MRNESICCNSAAFHRQKRDYLNIQRGIWKEPPGKQFCQHFCAPVSLVHSFTLLYSSADTWAVCLVYFELGKRLHTSQTSLITINIISWQSNCGKLSCLLSLSALTGHLFWSSPTPHPHPTSSPTCKTNTNTYHFHDNNVKMRKKCDIYLYKIVKIDMW